ncbi:hypothetical protein MKX08_001235 [Trichoderma sp. CBMAI-0020]|nr:hypothetical protein MKX08_001235 [Trichoderma sp. CBMAI-0020]
MFFIILIIEFGLPTLFQTIYKAYESLKSLFRPFRGSSHRTSSEAIVRSTIPALHLYTFTSSPLHLDLSAPLSLSFLLFQHPRKKAPFTLLSPPATIASSTNLSQDSSKSQSQSRYRSAIRFQEFEAYSPFIEASSLLHVAFSCYAAAPKTLRRSQAQIFSLKTIAKLLFATMMVNGTETVAGITHDHWVQKFWIWVFIIWMSVNVLLILILWPFRDWTDFL